MIDPLSTQFSEVQRETHRGVVGQQEYDRRTYEVLFGSEGDRPAARGRRAGLVVAAVGLLIVLGVAVWWVAAFQGMSFLL